MRASGFSSELHERFPSDLSAGSVLGDGYRATTLALAVVLAGASVVTGSAAALALAVVLSRAVVPAGRGAAALTLAVVLAGAPVVARTAAALTFALVVSFTRVLGRSLRRCALASGSGASAEGCAGHEAADRRCDQLVELASLHFLPRPLVLVPKPNCSAVWARQSESALGFPRPPALGGR